MNYHTIISVFLSFVYSDLLSNFGLMVVVIHFTVHSFHPYGDELCLYVWVNILLIYFFLLHVWNIIIPPNDIITGS